MADEDFSGGVVVGLFVGICIAVGVGNCGADYGWSRGKKAGRCVEMCRPEQFIERVNDGAECLCTTKRVRLAP